MIEIHGVRHYYQRRKGPVRQALDNIHLHVPEKTLCALTGPNGGGKSTLLRILTGLLLPGSGTVRLGGMDLHAHPLEVRRLMGVVFQHPALDAQLTLLENVHIHARLYSIGKKELDRSLDEDLEWTGLKDRLHERVGTLSGGQQRRVELVKALLHRPRLLLMDEPTTGLDPVARKSFWEGIFRFRDRLGLTILTTTHLFDEAEQADQVAILHQGRMLAHGAPEELVRNMGNEMIVLHAKDPETAILVQERLSASSQLVLQRFGRELRIEGASQEIIDTLLRQRKDQFHDIAIKRPTLQDFFIHVTAKAPEHSS
ncbi:MAG: ABC transporter ATP-binding protein [Magnetococcales bacterium]|nr:ABC transporter ATP-binding protein [Magnetococcales bacterium]